MHTALALYCIIFVCLYISAVLDQLLKCCALSIDYYGQPAMMSLGFSGGLPLQLLFKDMYVK